MHESYARFLDLAERERMDVFEAGAERLDTLASYVEKDFWVCLVLDTLYNRLPAGHPQLLFKGGTSLSKAFGLIKRFSEDIDLVVYPDGLGFGPDRDPASAKGLSNTARKARYDELRQACSKYICTRLAGALERELGARCEISVDEQDSDKQTLLIEYPTLYGADDLDYVLPRVKLEGGARSGLTPNTVKSLTPFVADELDDAWSFQIDGIHVLEPARTYLEKILILHGAFCGHRDEGRSPTDKDRISRHYYDVAMITDTKVGRAALADTALLETVRTHNLLAFNQAWKRFDQAVPGSVRIVPEGGLRKAIENDYQAMQGMMLGDAPGFDWVLYQLKIAEDALNEPRS